MKYKKIIVLFLFWWAVIYPQFFFSNEEQVYIQSGNVIYKSWVVEKLENIF